MTMCIGHTVAAMYKISHIDYTKVIEQGGNIFNQGFIVIMKI